MAEISTCTKTHCKDYSILALISLCLKSNYVFWCNQIVLLVVLVTINQIFEMITVATIKEA